MSREALSSPPPPEPEWWKDMREKVLNLSIDLEQFYDETEGFEALRVERKARLKRLEQLGAPQVIINHARELVAKDPYDIRQVAADTLSDFSKSTGGLTKGSFRLILPVLLGNARKVFNPVELKKRMDMSLGRFIWLAAEKDKNFLAFLRSIGKEDPEDVDLELPPEEMDEMIIGDGITQVVGQLLQEIEQGKL